MPAAVQPAAALAGAKVELLWDLPQVARSLGVSHRTVKRMVAAGELPGVVRLGRRVLVSRRALERWIESKVSR
jgi:excisionase family DNA binding protein